MLKIGLHISRVLRLLTAPLPLLGPTPTLRHQLLINLLGRGHVDGLLRCGDGCDNCRFLVNFENFCCRQTEGLLFHDFQYVGISLHRRLLVPQVVQTLFKGLIGT